MAGEVTSTPSDNVASSDTQLEDYSEVLSQYQAEFVHRYTELDPNFQAYLKKENDPPPIVEDFNSRPSYRDDGNRNYNRGYKRRYDDDRHRHGGHHQQQERRSYDRPPQGRGSYGGDRRPQFNRPWQDNRSQGHNRPWEDNRSHDRDRHGQDQGRDHPGNSQGGRGWQHRQGDGNRRNDWT